MSVAPVILGVADVYRQQRHTRILRSELEATTDPALTRAHEMRQVEKVTAPMRVFSVASEEDAALMARTIFFVADGVRHEAFAQSDDGDTALLDELVTMVRAYLSVRASG